ncbi:pyridoxal phosphate-dependent transferase [Lasiosphaeria ovina]|uniref:Pyridoxal phosphate-dependent transferase n=1 Tax=Lasiosphaeria ovina TaxID=92902 RepID=A0AAE0KCU9_9PEZI|nr:pyridoxal phosphate-dependent transferase [Lasiosphaeria ovina]
MKNIPEFRIDKWRSVAGALSLAELQALASAPGPDGAGAGESSAGPIDPELVLTYGDARGSQKLRARIAELHSSPAVTLTADNVVTTPGSIMANYLALASLTGPGDHAICMYPTFAQLWAIPRFQGAEVSMWKLKVEDGSAWRLSLDELKGMIKENTKVIILNNPNNPTGAVLPESMLRELIVLASERGITLYSDEVFAPLFHTSDPPPPPLISLGYPNTVSTGSMSKTIGLPGIRIGWVVSLDAAVIERIMTAHDYTTVAVSLLDDGVAAYALSSQVLPRLMTRSLAICARSIAAIGAFVARTAPRTTWVPPAGAGTAYVRILTQDGKEPVDDRDFVAGLARKTGVSLVPGGFCFEDGDDGVDAELKGYVRITLGNADESVLQEGLRAIEEFLKTY